MKSQLLSKLAQFSDSFGVYVMNSYDPSGYVSLVKVSTVDELRVALMSPEGLNPRIPGWKTDSAFDPTVDAFIPRTRARRRKAVVVKKRIAAKKKKVAKRLKKK